MVASTKQAGSNGYLHQQKRFPHTSTRSRYARYTLRTVLARIDRPESLDSATVSLTVDADTRVNFGVDEGVVTVE